MVIKKKTNELEIHYLDKVVKLRGHQDDDGRRESIRRDDVQYVRQAVNHSNRRLSIHSLSNLIMSSYS